MATDTADFDLAIEEAMAERHDRAEIFHTFMREHLHDQDISDADGVVYRTYVSTARGLELAMPYYALLDRTPKGRDERPGTPPWLRRHDEYQSSVAAV